jgi:hypothetical protein
MPSARPRWVMPVFDLREQVFGVQPSVLAGSQQPDRRMVAIRRTPVELDDDLLSMSSGEVRSAAEQGKRIDRIEMSPDAA